MGVLAVVLGGVGAGLLAGLATPWLRRLLDSGSRWLRRPVVVGLGLVIGVGAGLLSGDPFQLLALTGLAAGCALLVLGDLAAHRLPDRLVGPLYPVLALGLAASAVLQQDPTPWLRAALASLLLVLGYLALALVAPDKLGLGDVKLAGPLGFFLGWFGWDAVVLGALAGFVVGAVVSVLLLARGAGRQAEYPFGPCMVAGAVLGVLAGPALLPGLA